MGNKTNVENGGGKEKIYALKAFSPYAIIVGSHVQPSPCPY
jgi:hypothetical protein